LIDDKISSGKVALKPKKGCKNKDYGDINASISWKRLRNKFDPSYTPSLVKLEKQSHQCLLEKGKDPLI
jgi:hypothetical protein